MVKIPNTKLERNPVSIFGEKTADKHAVMTSSLSLSLCFHFVQRSPIYQQSTIKPLSDK